MGVSLDQLDAVSRTDDKNGPAPMNNEPTIAFSRRPTSTPLAASARAELLRDPGFGRVFTDHMVTIRWTKERGWHEAEVRAREPIALDPAAAVLHYGQEIFEGLKAYTRGTGSIALFGPNRMRAAFRPPPRAWRCRNCRKRCSWRLSMSW